MSTDDAPSRRDFDRLTTVVDRLTVEITNLRTDMAGLYVSRELYLSEKATQDKRIDVLFAALTWAIRIIVGAFLTGLAYMLWKQG